MGSQRRYLFLLSIFAVLGLLAPNVRAAQVSSDGGVSQALILSALERNGLLPASGSDAASTVETAAYVDSSNRVVMPSATGALRVSLPYASDQPEDVSSVGDRLLAFPSGGSTTDVVQFQAADQGDSVRLLNYIEDAAAPTEFAYTFELPDGAILQQTGDGGAVIVNNLTRRVYAAIAAPWATDARGAAVPTSYEVRGNQLVQKVKHAGAAYPVVADPWIQWGRWGFTVYFSRWDTNVLSWGAVGVMASFGWTGIAAGAAAALAAAAQYYISQGWCLAYYRPYLPSIGWWWPYRC